MTLFLFSLIPLQPQASSFTKKGCTENIEGAIQSAWCTWFTGEYVISLHIVAQTIVKSGLRRCNDFDIMTMFHFTQKIVV